MSLRVKILLPVLLFGIAILGLLTVSILQSWHDNERADAQALADRQVSLLLEATTAMALERGTGNGILANVASATPQAFARLATGTSWRRTGT